MHICIHCKHHIFFCIQPRFPPLNIATKVTRINATNSTIWNIHNAHTWAHHSLGNIHVWCDTYQSLLFFCKKNIYNFWEYRCRYFVSFNSIWVNLTLNNNSRHKHTTQMYSLTSATITRWANLSVLCVSLPINLPPTLLCSIFSIFLLLRWFTVDAMSVDR